MQKGSGRIERIDNFMDKQYRSNYLEPYDKIPVETLWEDTHEKPGNDCFRARIHPCFSVRDGGNAVAVGEHTASRLLTFAK